LYVLLPLWFLVAAPLVAGVTAYLLNPVGLAGEWVATVSFGVAGIATVGVLRRVGVSTGRATIGGLATGVVMAGLYLLIVWLSLRSGLYDGPGW
jgi:hypothetical protein